MTWAGDASGVSGEVSEPGAARSRPVWVVAALAVEALCWLGIGLVLTEQLMPFTSPDNPAWPVVFSRSAIWSSFLTEGLVPCLLLAPCAIVLWRRSTWWDGSAWAKISGVVAILVSLYFFVGGVDLALTPDPGIGGMRAMSAALALAGIVSLVGLAVTRRDPANTPASAKVA